MNYNVVVCRGGRVTEYNNIPYFEYDDTKLTVVLKRYHPPGGGIVQNVEFFVFPFCSIEGFKIEWNE